MKTTQLTDGFYWAGTLDPDLRVFDIIMQTEFGTTYNSYVLKTGGETVIFETSKEKRAEEYIETLKSLVDLQTVSMLVVNHTEPDHAGCVEKLLEINPGLKIVGSSGAINFLKEITNRDFTAVPVKTGDSITAGGCTLQFYSVPNLHWPDSMFTYIPEKSILVTCDVFGSHYSHEGITNENLPSREDYMKSLRYYFDCIFGPFKKDVLFAVDAIKDLDIKIIACGHGPVLTKNPREIVDIYKEWSTPPAPRAEKSIVIPYVSAYGYTARLAERVSEGAKAAGVHKVLLFDLVTANNDEVAAELGAADGALFGTPTIIGEALKPIWDLTTSIFAKTHGGKLASAFGSYGWSGEGVPHIMERLRQLKLKIYGDGLRVRFKPSPADLQTAFEFGYGFGLSVLAGEPVKSKKSGQRRQWRCLVCGEIIESNEAPESCPVCGVGAENFTEVESADVDFSSDARETFIIIGNGAAGLSAAAEIRKRNKSAEIEMISKENEITYNRPMLTKGILSDIAPVGLYVRPKLWYSDNKIRLTLGTAATAIDTSAKTVTLSGGEVKKYDKLLLASGAECFRPPLPGADKAGVFTIRSLEDVKNLREYLKNARSAVVIGGGPLGLEAAWELKKSGKTVSLVETFKRLMGRQLDEKASALLREAAEKSGLAVLTGAGVKEVSGDSAAKAVLLADGRELPADVVILSTGISPNVEIAKTAGIESGRFIKVNQKCETSAPGVYACGDCAEFEGVSFGLWSQALDMGRVAGINASGDTAVYTRPVPPVYFSGFGASVFSIGDLGSDPAKKYKTLEIDDPAKGAFEKLYFVNGRFVGGILFGDVSKSARLTEACLSGAPARSLLN
ncbi:MAG: FAD-dependent oxidoreductase [Clostridiales bacterium]|jgi:flavorubredoxin/NADPH-dependent 2,4-dienoyl-CoA reductase/sulfur reductase-like enzyme|nr:FAD-dependent oxidoreductase [Clostridiales bacterium]